STVKKLPRNSSRTMLSTWSRVVWATEPIMLTSRSAKMGRRIVTISAAYSGARNATPYSQFANCVRRRWSAHMRELQYAQDELLEIHSGHLRCHRHQAVPGHARRGVQLQQRDAAVGAPDQVRPAPARAIQRLRRAHDHVLDRTLLGCGQFAGAKVAGLVA